MAQSLLIPRFQAQGPLARLSGRQSLANVHLNFSSDVPSLVDQGEQP